MYLIHFPITVSLIRTFINNIRKIWNKMNLIHLELELRIKLNIPTDIHQIKTEFNLNGEMFAYSTII